jgi:hypothetical protein
MLEQLANTTAHAITGKSFLNIPVDFKMLHKPNGPA